MSEAVYSNPGKSVGYTPEAAITAGQVVQVADGRAAVAPSDIEASVLGTVDVVGIYDVTKSADVVILNGAPIYWDHSANSATPVPQYADRDFYLGMAQEDALATATTFKVALNARPHYIIDLNGGAMGANGGDTAVVLTAGTPTIVNRGGMLEAAFSLTAEAQKLDWLSRRSFPKTANFILEAMVEVVTTCDADVGDLSVGIADATHASDLEAGGTFAVVHLDLGADLNIDVTSDDTVTDVAITDTTIDFVEGTPFHIAIDGRDPTDLQFYINGVLVAGATAFTLAGSSAALKAIFHLEKSSNDSPGIVQCDMLRVRIAE